MDNKSKQFVVEKYLEQVKILTALASALFISPSIVLGILRLRHDIQIAANTLRKATFLITLSCIFFLVVIILTYFIYSSIVGLIAKDEYDIHRKLTRILSILQFAALIGGCIFFIRFLTLLL